MADSSHCVLVSGLPSSLTLPSVIIYLQNSSRSGGGDVREGDCKDLGNGQAIICFEKQEDASNVLSRSPHQVTGDKGENIVIRVEPYTQQVEQDDQTHPKVQVPTPVSSSSLPDRSRHALPTVTAYSRDGGPGPYEYGYGQHPPVSGPPPWNPPHYEQLYPAQTSSADQTRPYSTEYAADGSPVRYSMAKYGGYDDKMEHHAVPSATAMHGHPTHANHLHYPYGYAYGPPQPPPGGQYDRPYPEHGYRYPPPQWTRPPSDWHHYYDYMYRAPAAPPPPPDRQPHHQVSESQGALDATPGRARSEPSDSTEYNLSELGHEPVSLPANPGSEAVRHGDAGHPYPGYYPYGPWYGGYQFPPWHHMYPPRPPVPRFPSQQQAWADYGPRPQRPEYNIPYHNHGENWYNPTHRPYYAPQSQQAGWPSAPSYDPPHHREEYHPVTHPSRGHSDTPLLDAQLGMPARAPSPYDQPQRPTERTTLSGTSPAKTHEQKEIKPETENRGQNASVSKDRNIETGKTTADAKKDIDLIDFEDDESEEIETNPVLEVHGLKPNTQEEHIKYYFENKQRSGGGETENVEIDEANSMAFVIFKDKPTAERVLQREHSVNGEKVTVVKSVTRITTPQDNRRLALLRVPEDANEELLRMWLENVLKNRACIDICESEVVLSYSDCRTKVVVTFPSDIDIAKVIEKCGEYPLKQKKINAQAIHKTNCCVVFNAKKEDEELIRLYFERITGAHVGLMKWSEQYCLLKIFFDTYKAIESLMSQGTSHKIANSMEVTVFPFSEPFDTSLLPIDESLMVLKPIAVGVKKEVVQFIKQSPTIEAGWKQVLAGCKACPVFHDDDTSGQVIIEPMFGGTQPSQERMKWGREVQEKAQQLLSEIDVEEVPFPHMISREKLSAFCDKDVMALEDQLKEVIILVGKQPKVTKVKQELVELCENEKRRADRVRRLTSKSKPLTPIHIRLLEQAKYFEKVFDEQEVKISGNIPGEIVIIHGTPEEIADVETKIDQQCKAFASESVKRDKIQLEFLGKLPVRERIQEGIQCENINAILDHRSGQIIYHGWTSDDVNAAKQVVEDVMGFQEIPVPGDSVNALQSVEFQTLRSSLTDNDTCIIQQREQNGDFYLAVVTFAEYLPDVSESIRSFLQDVTQTSTTVTFPSPATATYIYTYMNDRLRKLERDFNVQVSKTPDSSFVIQGSKNVLQKAEDRLKDLAKDLCHDSLNVELDHGAAAEHFTDRQGSESVKRIAKENNCVIETRREGSIQWLAKTTLQSTVVNIGEGNILGHNADVLVHSVNSHLESKGDFTDGMHSQGGKRIKEECEKHFKTFGSLGVGEIFCSSAGKLNYSCIFHVVTPVKVTKVSASNIVLDDKELASRLQLCVSGILQRADSFNYKSVCMPLLGSGRCGIDPQVCIETVINALMEYFNDNMNTQITRIDIVDFNRDNAQAMAFFLKEATGATDIGHVEDGLDIATAMAEGTFAYGDTEARSGPGELPSLAMALPLEPVAGASAEPIISTIPPEHVFTTKEGSNVYLIVAAIEMMHVNIIVNTTISDDKPDSLDSGGVSKAINIAAGEDLQQEFNLKRKGKKLASGDVVVTGPADLTCIEIYHVFCPRYDGSKDGAPVKSLKSLVRKCLDQAQTDGHRSIAFPAIGTGGLEFPAEVAAENMYTEVQVFSKKNPKSSVKHIYFVLFEKDPKTVEGFRKYVENKLDKASANRKKHIFTDLKDASPKSKKMVVDSRVTLIGAQGDITEENVKGIINSTNEALQLSKGAVSKVIEAKAGKTVQEEMNKLLSAGLVPNDGTFVTTAGKLPCDVIVHVILARFKTIKEAARRCLKMADSQCLTSVAFPLLGAGIKHDDTAAVRTASKSIIEAVGDFVIHDNPKHLDIVKVTIFSKKEADVFHKEMKEALKLKVAASGYTAGAKGKLAASVPSGLRLPPALSVDWHLSFFSGLFGKAKKGATGVRERLEFSICTATPADGERVKKQIQEMFEKELVRLDVRVDEQLSREYASAIQAVSEKYKKAKISFERATKRILICGLGEEPYKARTEISDIVHMAEKARAETEMICSTVMWVYFKETGEHVKLPQNLIVAVERELQKSSLNVKQTFTFGEQRYQIEFSSKTQAVLENNANFKETIFRRPAKPDLPLNWENQGDTLTPCEVVALQASSEEYKRMAKFFTDTCEGKCKEIIGIQRIENPTMYRQFLQKKKQMEETNPQGMENARFLFHGTSEDAVKNINLKGFNRSYCGKNAVAYGNGVYFARGSYYSADDRYSIPNAKGEKFIYIGHVLTGEYTQGKRGIVEPGTKGQDTHGRILSYDSVVDNMADPFIFVIFHDTMAYPAYLVTFKGQATA